MTVSETGSLHHWFLSKLSGKEVMENLSLETSFSLFHVLIPLPMPLPHLQFPSLCLFSFGFFLTITLNTLCGGQGPASVIHALI